MAAAAAAAAAGGADGRLSRAAAQLVAAASLNCKCATLQAGKCPLKGCRCGKSAFHRWHLQAGGGSGGGWASKLRSGPRAQRQLQKFPWSLVAQHGLRTKPAAQPARLKRTRAHPRSLAVALTGCGIGQDVQQLIRSPFLPCLPTEQDSLARIFSAPRSQPFRTATQPLQGASWRSWPARACAVPG